MTVKGAGSARWARHVCTALMAPLARATRAWSEGWLSSTIIVARTSSDVREPVAKAGSVLSKVVTSLLYLLRRAGSNSRQLSSRLGPGERAVAIATAPPPPSFPASLSFLPLSVSATVERSLHRSVLSEHALASARGTRVRFGPYTGGVSVRSAQARGGSPIPDVLSNSHALARCSDP
jgi:hypothetical protein